MLPPVTDAGLIRSAAEGDTGALEKLVREFAPSVYAYLAGMLGDERDAEEGMQETFVRLARAVDRYDSDTDAEAWVFDIARRVSGDMRPTPAAPPGEPPPAEGDPDEWLRRSLRALPIELREVLVYIEILRWDTDRIAASLGIESEDVLRRSRAARQQIAEGMRGLH